MSRLTETKRAAIRADLAGLTDNQKLVELASIVDPRIIRAHVQVEPAETPGVYFTDLTRKRPESAAVRFTDEEEKQIRALGHDPATVALRVGEIRAQNADLSRPMTAREEAELRRQGIDPALIARVGTCRNVEDFKKLRAELDGGAR